MFEVALRAEGILIVAHALGVRDSSGLRFTYTNRIRQYDAGIFEIGHAVGGVQHLIPPNAPSFLSHGECSAQCLRQVFYHIFVLFTNT